LVTERNFAAKFHNAPKSFSRNSSLSPISPRILRYSNWDALLIGLSLLHAAALAFVPSTPLIALGIWWNSNTISHNFVHLPFFRSSLLNRAYSLYLSVLLGIPQTLWRERHLAHHRGQSARFTHESTILIEAGLILGLWAVILIEAPRFFWTTYLPGYAIGLVLCYLHGYFEHAGGTTSHYSAAYNISFFNDGYHVEHHARPGEHWTRLPGIPTDRPRTSRWPAVVRWIEIINLERLEKIALRSRLLQSLLLRTHERALRKLLPDLRNVRSATIVGGGMYPRTALLLRRLLPEASLRIVDANADHLEMAKPFLDDHVDLIHDRYIPGQTTDADLLVVPLSFCGSREEIYRNPPARAVLVHDWIWSKHGRSAIASLLLLKRINLIVR
jgi:hypothetical protein